MPERVAVGRIIVGTEQGRKVIEPGTRFNTDEYSIDAEQLEKWDKNRTVREPRDQRSAEGEETPRQQSRRGHVVEGRSGPAHDVTNPSESEQRGEQGRVLSQPAGTPLEEQPPTRPAQPAQRQPAPAPESHPDRRRRSDTDL